MALGPDLLGPKPMPATNPAARLQTSKVAFPGNPLAVQWLGLSALTAGARVQSLVWELRSHKPHSKANK